MILALSATPRHIFLVSLVVAAVIGGSVSFVYLQSATITITPRSETKTANQTIIISAAATSPDFVMFKIPATIITAAAAKEKTFTRGNEATFADNARGHVTLYNQQDTEQQLLPNTHLRHEATGIFFLTDTGVSIPPRGTIGLTVTAEAKGSSGNVASGRFIIDKLPPYLQPKIYGESDQAFSGGLAVSTPVSQEEIDQAKQELMNSLNEQLLSDLTEQASGRPLNPTLVDYQETEANVSAPIGSRASEFRISLKAQGQAFIVDDNDLLGLTLLKLRSLSGPEQEFLEYDPRSFQTTMIKRDFEHQEAIIESSLTGTFSSKISPTAFSSSNLAGLTPAEVQERLAPMPGVGQVSVKLSPFWVRSIPSRRGAVKIAVGSE